MSQPVTGGLPSSVPLDDYTVVYAKLNKTLADYAKLETEVGRLLEIIESMDKIHHDIMDNGPSCTCGDADDWCSQCAKSTKLSSLARKAVNNSPAWKTPVSGEGDSTSAPCPIGLGPTPHLCSAGTCSVCQAMAGSRSMADVEHRPATTFDKAPQPVTAMMTPEQQHTREIAATFANIWQLINPTLSLSKETIIKCENILRQFAKTASVTNDTVTKLQDEIAVLKAAEWYKSLTKDEREAAEFYADLESMSLARSKAEVEVKRLTHELERLSPLAPLK